MKQSLFLAVAFLLIITGCKKQNDATKPLKTKMIGKWQVTKVETTVGSSPATTVSYSSSDYVDFKAGEDDIVEMNLAPNLQSGTYVVTVGNSFNISVGGKLHTCVPVIIEDNRFEFTANESDSNPLVVRKYYLKR